MSHERNLCSNAKFLLLLREMMSNRLYGYVYTIFQDIDPNLAIQNLTPQTISLCRLPDPVLRVELRCGFKTKIIFFEIKSKIAAISAATLRISSTNTNR